MMSEAELMTMARVGGIRIGPPDPSVSRVEALPRASTAWRALELFLESRELYEALRLVKLLRQDAQR